MDENDKLYQSVVLDINYTPRDLQRKVWFEPILIYMQMWKRKLAKIEKVQFAVAVMEEKNNMNQCKDILTKLIHCDNMISRVDFNS